MNVDTTGAAPDRPRVLVVDDDNTILAVARDALGAAGFAVETAVDGEAALKLLEAALPDLILLDVMLPGVDGITLCRQLRADPRTCEIPICIMTGLDDKESIRQAYDAGATDFVIKPPSWTILSHHLLYLRRASSVARELSAANTRLLHEISGHERTAAALRESEERLRLALMATNQGLYDLNVQTGETVVSPEYARMLGYEPGEFVESNARWRERLHAADREKVSRIYEQYIAGVLSEYRVEFRQRTKAGDWKWILSLGKVVERDKEGRPLRMLGTHTDITERKELEQVERDQRQLAEALRDTALAINSTLKLDEVLDRILDNIGKIAAYDAVFIVMLESDGARLVRHRGTPLLRAPGAAAPLHYHQADLPLLERILDTRRPCFISNTAGDPACASGCRMIPGMRSCLGIPLEIRGSVVGAIVLTSATPGRFTAAGAQRLSAFASQASVAIENARLFERAYHLSVTDGLTGLINRRHFFDIAKIEYERTRRHARPLSLAMIDIDRFKTLNDRWGHLAGDAVLREIARRIRETVRTIDIVARYGGEEFVVLMPETDLAEALLVSGRVCRSVAENPVVDSGVAVAATVSVGVAEINDECASIEDVLKCADKALYAAKEAGRNRVEAYRDKELAHYRRTAPESD